MMLTGSLLLVLYSSHMVAISHVIKFIRLTTLFITAVVAQSRPSATLRAPQNDAVEIEHTQEVSVSTRIAITNSVRTPL